MSLGYYLLAPRIQAPTPPVPLSLLFWSCRRRLGRENRLLGRGGGLLGGPLQEIGVNSMLGWGWTRCVPSISIGCPEYFEARHPNSSMKKTWLLFHGFRRAKYIKWKGRWDKLILVNIELQLQSNCFTDFHLAFAPWRGTG